MSTTLGYTQKKIEQKAEKRGITPEGYIYLLRQKRHLQRLHGKNKPNKEV